MEAKHSQLNRMTLSKMMDAARLIQGATGNTELGLHELNVFLFVAARHPELVPMVEIERTFGLLQTTTSRVVGYWTSKGAHRRDKGYGMFKVEVDPFYAKRKLVGLTAKGEQLAGRLSHALGIV